MLGGTVSFGQVEDKEAEPLAEELCIHNSYLIVDGAWSMSGSFCSVTCIFQYIYMYIYIYIYIAYLLINAINERCRGADNSMMCRGLRKLTMWMSRLLRLDFGLLRFSTEAVVIVMHVVAAPCAGSSPRAWGVCAGADLSSWAICHVDFSGIISMDSRWSCSCR